MVANTKEMTTETISDKSELESSEEPAGQLEDDPRILELPRMILFLLETRGPLCASQISVETGFPVRTVNVVLKKLASEEYVVKSPDRNPERKFTPEESPWSLPRVIPRIFGRRAR